MSKNTKPAATGVASATSKIPATKNKGDKTPETTPLQTPNTSGEAAKSPNVETKSEKGTLKRLEKHLDTLNEKGEVEIDAADDQAFNDAVIADERFKGKRVFFRYASGKAIAKFL